VKRILCIDYGTKHIGIAISDPLGITAQPLDTIPGFRPGIISPELIKLCSQYEISQIVVGLPLNMNGSEGASAVSVREFARILENKLQVPIHFWDERLT